MKHTLLAWMRDKPGVLNRVSGMLRRRNFNIDSLTVGRTHKEHVSRMTIVLDSERIKELDFSGTMTSPRSILYEVDALGEAHVVMKDALRNRRPLVNSCWVPSACAARRHVSHQPRVSED